MTAQLLEGSDAVAHAMVAAGCRFFAGYPMTPFTEVLEHMAKLLPAVDGVCMNAESELEAVGMAWGAAATSGARRRRCAWRRILGAAPRPQANALFTDGTVCGHMHIARMLHALLPT